MLPGFTLPVVLEALQQDSSVLIHGCTSPSVNPSFIPQVVTKNLLNMGGKESHIAPAPTLVEWKLGDFERLMAGVLKFGSLVPKLKTRPWKFQTWLRDSAQDLPGERPPGLPCL